MGTECVGYNVWEAVEELTSRTILGRVVVEPPTAEGKPVKPKLIKQPDLWYFCKCRRAFKSAELLKEHQETHPENFKPDWRQGAPEDSNSLRCMHCAKTFPTVTSLRNHLSSHTGEKPWECEKCPATFRLHSTLFEHTKTSHVQGGEFKCPYCPCRFKYSLNLTRHVGYYHPDSKPVDEVKEETNSSDDHSMVGKVGRRKPFTPVVQEDGTRKYPCNVCGRLFSRSVYLRNHLPVHTGERNSICNLCGVGFKSSSNLYTHKKVSHVEGGKHRCERCPCVFATLLGLVSHKRIFHGPGVKPLLFKKIALAKMASKGKIIPAKVTPRIARNFLPEATESLQVEPSMVHNCDQCDKSFVSIGEFENHKQIHSGEKPCVCSICGLGFRLNSTLKVHKRTSHVPNGPFKCDRCACTFGALFGLRRHQNCFHDMQASATGRVLREPSDFLELSLGENEEAQDKGETEDMLSYEDEIEPALPMPAVQRRKKVLDKVHQCLKCFRTFGHSRTLRKHSRAAHVVGGKKCTACSCSFATTQARKSHFTKYHTKNGSQNIPTTPVLKASQHLEKLPKSPTNVTKESTFHATKPNQVMGKLPGCKNCGKKFASEVSLRSHVRYCTQEASFRCEHCGEAFTIQANMIRHIRSCHVPNGPFKCRLCTHSYATQRGFMRHSAQVHGIKRLRDPADAMAEVQEDEMNSGNNQVLEGAGQNDHSKQLRCGACDEVFVSRSSFKKHMLSSHVIEGSFPCKQCTCVFATYNALNAHVGYRHPTVKRNALSQNKAANKFGRASSSATSSTPSPSLVPQRKPDVPRLSPMKLNFIAPPSLRNFAKQPTELMRRMAMIVGGGNATSPVPEPESRSPVAMATTETQQFNVQDFCVTEMEAQNDAFGFSTGDTPTCNVCGKTYSSFHSLRIHSSVHTGEKPWPCDLCGLMFRQRGDIVSHKRTNHVKDGKYKCKLCPCRFLTPQGYKRHNLMVHETVQKEKSMKTVNGSSSGSHRVEKEKQDQESRKCKVTLAFASETSPIPETNFPNYGEDFLCDLCDASFDDHSNLARHKKTSHVPWGEFKCSYCSCSFVSGTSLKTHEAMFHPETRKVNTFRRSETPRGSQSFHEAETSERQTATLNMSMDYNLSYTTNDTSMEISSTVTANPTITPVPARVSGKKVFLCSSCNGKFQSFAGCMKHIETGHVEGGEFPCVLCSCVFPGYRGLVAHVGIYHPGQKSTYADMLGKTKRSATPQRRNGNGSAVGMMESANYGYSQHLKQSSSSYAVEVVKSYKNAVAHSHADNFEEEEHFIPEEAVDTEMIDPLDISEEVSSRSFGQRPRNKFEPVETEETYDDESDDQFFEPNLDELRARVPALTVTRVSPEKPDPKSRHSVFGNGNVLQKGRVNRFAIYGKK